MLEIKSKESINSRKKDKNEENITTPHMWSDVVCRKTKEENRKLCGIARRNTKEIARNPENQTKVATRYAHK